jgi:hypothetical protein
VEQVLWQLFNLAAGHPPPPPFVFDIRLLIFNEKQNYLQADPKNWPVLVVSVVNFSGDTRTDGDVQYNDSQHETLQNSWRSCITLNNLCCVVMLNVTFLALC